MRRKSRDIHPKAIEAHALKRKGLSYPEISARMGVPTKTLYEYISKVESFYKKRRFIINFEEPQTFSDTKPINTFYLYAYSTAHALRLLEQKVPGAIATVTLDRQGQWPTVLVDNQLSGRPKQTKQPALPLLKVSRETLPQTKPAALVPAACGAGQPSGIDCTTPASYHVMFRDRSKVTACETCALRLQNMGESVRAPVKLERI